RTGRRDRSFPFLVGWAVRSAPSLIASGLLRPGRRGFMPDGAPSHRLQRETFRTSRLLAFCSDGEPITQTGHQVDDWPLVIVKALVDNALDAAEEAGIAPVIAIDISTETGEIVIADNGPGIPAETIDGILDFTVRVSSREAYVSPTRGAQGN